MPIFCTFIGIRQTDMLPLQHTIQFSDYSELYDLIIPQDNLLRRIKDLVDFSFIQKELMDKYCHDNGLNYDTWRRLTEQNENLPSP